MTWQRRAACLGMDTELWFPAGAHGSALETAAATAKAVCADCSVRAACLTEALHRGELGIWGGTDELERRKLAQALKVASSW